ncbi:Dihydrodipicolinate synthase family protein [Rhodovastum atsumiense]|uniref:Dihydrodipicolinate synthase family protein n=1 Tax=Rhodovastum atsumiense TaxID=504468 RepID=A0A5M6J1Y8_9PROT|nr:dihydrodipicolinate synthase family protein [Rhodovastum atsumiense]KAA5614097.1 dihydrodipicolinate synthase family protein [Rhodovastum atsumiense]CAH2598933.1 Dihydrodipicolinate synthase family protein [Rhodovastum atsumiense]
MATSCDWQGVFPAVTTKFTASGALDAAACEKHFAWLLQNGCDGLIVSGSLGEGSTLTPDEKLELARIARTASGGKSAVVLTIAEGATARMLDLLKRAEAQGVDGVMLLPPMMYRASAEETIAWYTTAAQATGLPLMVYNNPVSYGIDVTVEMLRRLAEIPNIVAVKESSDDVRRVIQIRNALGTRLRIFAGVDNLALESCLVGADGWIAGLVDAFPAETVAIWQLARAGRLDEALAIYRWFSPLLELDVSPRLVQNIKLAEALVGVGTEIVRAPRLPLAGTERGRVEAVLREALRTRPALPALPVAA